MQMPKINRLDAENLFERVRELGSVYLPAWRPRENEPGWAVVRAYSFIYEALADVADDLPERLFLAYLDSLGFTPAPARAATVPIHFELAKNFDSAVTIPKGTAVESVSKVRYETERDFTAVSANITAVIEADPSSNEVTDITEGTISQKGALLFEKERIPLPQYIYFGDDDLFNIHRFLGDPNAYLEFLVPIKDAAAWEYWGKGEADEEPSWRAFTFSGNDLNKKGNTTTVKREIEGITTYWIRAKLMREVSSINDFTVVFKSRSGIDALYYNDVAIDPSRNIYPFGYLPQRNDSFYMASSEAFSKRGAYVAVDFGNESGVTVEDDGTVKFGSGIVSFEYFNGTSWKPLKTDKYGKNGVRVEKECDIEFKVPYDLAKTSVNGDKNLWIRCRLSGGSYTCTEGSAGLSFSIPVFSYIDIYVKPYSRRPSYLLRHAHGSFEDLLESGGWREPYSILSEEKALYIGFDRDFGEGSVISMLFIPRNKREGIKPLLKWFYSASDGWSTLPTKDGTNGFEQVGFTLFIAPKDQKRVELFGKELYWIKIVFPEEASEIYLEGLYINAVEATQSQRVEREIVGSSDGTAFQRFAIANTPAFDPEVFVLEPDIPREGNYIEDSQGSGYWVLWSLTDKFSGLRSSDRCYIFDSYAGTIIFGDGVEGKIPPMVKNGISVSYRYGGGSAGNVEAGKIRKLIDTLSHVNKVTNPLPAEGGADEESIDSFIVTAPLGLKHRYRAVRGEDYRALARRASSDIAKVDIATDTGRVDIFIIPHADGARPYPDMKVRKRVQDYIYSSAAATATISVRPPVYIPVGFKMELLIDDWSKAALIKSEMEKKLKDFLHPLNGGRDLKGWQFAQQPALSDIIGIIGSEESIHDIVSLKMIVDIPGDDILEFTLGDNEKFGFESGWMVCSGEHDIDIGGV